MSVVRNRIFETIESCPHHRFYILTKFPENIDRPMPHNVWLGITITGRDDLWRINYLGKAKAKLKFISFEPLLDFALNRFYRFNWFDWVIVGRLTGYGRKYDPKKFWLRSIFYECKDFKGIPIFLKDNLKGIWGESLIQEMPEEE